MKNKYKLTETGEKHCWDFLQICMKQRKHILAAGSDTAEKCVLPTLEDIIGDIEAVGADEDNLYYNSWSITDNYLSDDLLILAYNIDFVRIG